MVQSRPAEPAENVSRNADTANFVHTGRDELWDGPDLPMLGRGVSVRDHGPRGWRGRRGRGWRRRVRPMSQQLRLPGWVLRGERRVRVLALRPDAPSRIAE